MKQLFGLLVALAITFTSFAQTGTKMKDCVVMQDGKMMSMHMGAKMAMDKDMTMTNGTMVMTDGTVKMKDGTTKMLKNGEYVGMDGKMGKMKMDKMDKMKMDGMKKDSM